MFELMIEVGGVWWCIILAFTFVSAGFVSVLIHAKITGNTEFF